MLNLAVAEQECVEQVDHQWVGLSENERRLIGRFRQMTELERHQVRRLIDQLAKHPDDAES
ncbi:hypothetical protein [Pseudomonas mosselii]|uniref:hypothetical protein n=1 Tax=Pseudomonas mosselii TaxID=78327 RepID=UPI002022F32A|nr:hypothetical protein [Pseudomonas mosselii]MCL8302168.1 hypothetical protein [Pseudomonas mosselii]